MTPRCTPSDTQACVIRAGHKSACLLALLPACLAFAGPARAEVASEFWPEIGVFVQLNDRSRACFDAAHARGLQRPGHSHLVKADADVGRHVLVQWDLLHVRVLDMRSHALLREHVRQKPGRFEDADVDERPPDVLGRRPLARGLAVEVPDREPGGRGVGEGRGRPRQRPGERQNCRQSSHRRRWRRAGAPDTAAPASGRRSLRAAAAHGAGQFRSRPCRAPA